MLDRQTASSGTICVFVTPATSTRTRIATHRAVPIWLCFSHAPTSFALDYHGQAQLQSFKSSIVLLAPFSLHQLPGTSKSIAPVGSSHLGLIIPQCSRLCLRTPFLRLGEDPDEGPLCDRPICERVHCFTPDITGFYNRLTFGLHSSLVTTHISDPPCMRARVALS
jgi:hypothetical protein